MPLPQAVRCYAIAGTMSREHDDLGGKLLGDGLVYPDSALGRHGIPERTLALSDHRTWIAYGVGHIELINHPGVYHRILKWFEEAV